MERWRRVFAENDKDFKELFGVKKGTFLPMHDILTAAALERRKKGGRRPALSPGDQLFLTLQYWREYRTMKHLAFDFGISKSTVSDNTAAQRIGNDIETSTLFLPYFPEQNNLSSSEMFLNNLGIQLSPVVFTLKIGGYGGYPRSVMDLEKQFSTEDACKDYLFRLRWPNGFLQTTQTVIPVFAGMTKNGTIFPAKDYLWQRSF